MPTLPGCMGFIKSSGNPLVDVAGAYFPAWLAASLLGLVACALLGMLLGGGRFSFLLRPSALMLPSWFVLFTCAAWLLLFAAR